jgi:hypothetical protein
VGEQSVIFQRIPSEFGDAVKVMQERYQLPHEEIVKAALAMLYSESMRDPVRIERYMDGIRREYERGFLLLPG